MMWVLVATNIIAVLRCTSGAALPEATSHSSDDTTLVHAGHHAEFELTDQGLFQLTRVKKQIQSDRAPVIFRYNSNVPSSEGLRKRRQLQQTSNAIGQPTVQFFTNAGNFNREIQRLFGSIQGQTSTTGGVGDVASSSIQGADPSSIGFNTASSLQSNTNGVALGSSTQEGSVAKIKNTGISIADTRPQQANVASPLNSLGESTRQATTNLLNANVAGTDAALTASTSSGNSNIAGIPNHFVGVTINEANELVAFERSKHTGNSQAIPSAQGNNHLGVPILLPLFSNANTGSNAVGTSNNVNLLLEGNFGGVGGENQLSSNSVDATANTRNNAKTLTSSIPEGTVVNTENAGIRLTDTRPQSSVASPLNFITNFPTQSIDNSNLFTNFGNAGTSQGNGEPVVVVVPNGVRSIFGLNNQLSSGTLNLGVNNEQNNAIANDGVAAAGIRRLKDLIKNAKNPSGQSPRDIFLNELANSGISGPLQTTITNSNPRSSIAQSFSNFGGIGAINQVNNEQIHVNAENQGLHSGGEQAPVQVLESQQPSIGSLNNQLGLTSEQQQQQQQPQNIGQVNANLPSQGAQLNPNQNLILIPLHFQPVNPGGNNSPVLIADPSDPKGFREQGFATIVGNSQSQSQQSLTGTNNNRQSSQFGATPINTIQSNFHQQNLLGGPLSQLPRVNTQGNNQLGGPLSQLPRVNTQGNNQLGGPLNQLPRVNTHGNNQLIPLPFAPRGPAQVGFFSDRFCTPIHRCKIISNFGTFVPVRK